MHCENREITRPVKKKGASTPSAHPGVVRKGKQKPGPKWKC